MKTAEQLQARRFGGNGDVLCDIGRSGCAFVRIQGSDKAFCLLYNMSLSYVETGNNDICKRCDNCLRESQQESTENEEYDMNKDIKTLLELSETLCVETINRGDFTQVKARNCLAHIKNMKANNS